MRNPTLEVILFLWSAKNNHTKMTKILIDYAMEHNITLKLNEKGFENGYPLLWSIKNNNFDITNSLIDYSNKNIIVLKLNEDEY